MSQFLMDYKRERLLDSKLFHHASAAQSAFTPTDTYNSGVLDLSRPSHHRDSIETRKTPSPSNTSSFSSSNEGSPGGASTHRERSPINNLIKISKYSPKSNHSLSNHYEHHAPYSPVTNEIIDPAGQSINRFSPNNFQMHSHQHAIAMQNNFRNTPSPNLMMATNSSILCKSPLIDPTETNQITSTNLNVSTSSTSSSNNGYPMIVGRDGKLSRPFKAYPHDPLSIAASFTATDTLLDTQSAEKYTTFRKRMLEQIHAANGGYPTVSNPKMRRTPSKQSASDNSAGEILAKTLINNNNDITTTNNNIKQFLNINNHTNISNNNNNNNDDSDNNNSNGSSHGGIKDQAYYERRKKNNAAAKKSRDRRRIKEDEIAIRAAFLERENIELKFELAAARKQLQLYGVTACS